MIVIGKTEEPEKDSKVETDLVTKTEESTTKKNKKKSED